MGNSCYVSPLVGIICTRINGVLKAGFFGSTAREGRSRDLTFYLDTNSFKVK